MDTPTKKITTPQAKAVIEIKDWITGAEAEYIEDIIISGVKTKTEGARISVGGFDATVIREQTHREVESFIVSVDGKIENVVEAVTALPEDDYEFVKNEIAERRKKKAIPEVES